MLPRVRLPFLEGPLLTVLLTVPAGPFLGLPLLRPPSGNLPKKPAQQEVVSPLKRDALSNRHALRWCDGVNLGVVTV